MEGGKEGVDLASAERDYLRQLHGSADLRIVSALYSKYFEEWNTSAGDGNRRGGITRNAQKKDHEREKEEKKRASETKRAVTVLFKRKEGEWSINEGQKKGGGGLCLVLSCTER
jgi:hypothetical protein